MGRIGCLALAIVLVGLLAAIRQFLGERVFYLAAGLSALWFAIAFVLLTLPPKVPEIDWGVGIVNREHRQPHEQAPCLPLAQRMGLSLSVANALCLLLWVSLVVFRR